MRLPLQPYLSRTEASLNVSCPTSAVVITSFEPSLPDFESIVKIDVERISLPTNPYWCKANCDYYAFLPRERWFHGHLLSSLDHRNSLTVQKDERWYIDDETCSLWRSLDDNLTKTIAYISGGMLVDLDHHEPAPAIKYGFSRGHKSERNLRSSLTVSKIAFVHRLAYLAYIISLRYQWDQDLVSQEWWRNFSAKFRPTWVDSVWDWVYRQWGARNFAGVVVSPRSSSVRWLRGAFNFGVPIWVMFPRPDSYEALDGGFVMKQWLPTMEQVHMSRKANQELMDTTTAETPPLPQPSMDIYTEPEADPTPLPSTNLPLEHPANSEPFSPPATLPENARWYPSWERFFEERDAAYTQHLQTATEAQKTSWESLVKNAAKFYPPGKKGARVYTWEACDTGGFFRILQTRYEASRDWASNFKKALRFCPRSNTWDYCRFMWLPALAGGSPDDEDDDDDDCVEPQWFTDPDPPATRPNDNPESRQFLYARYGFLDIEPEAPPKPIIPHDKSAAYRIVGLGAQHPGEPPDHLDAFITSIIRRQVPAGHCDLSFASPPNESFSGKAFISNAVSRLQRPGFSDEALFIIHNTPDTPSLLAIYEPLSVLQLVREGTQPNLEAQLQLLLKNGSRFTLLYSVNRPLGSLPFNALPFPIRIVGWRPKYDDFRAYMSRLTTFFHERPYVAAAAFSRGGIAWRIALEVLGLEGSVNTLLTTYPDQRSSLRIRRGVYWDHKLNDDEWFYLVGGCEVLTGKGDQTEDLSWWPKVTTWEGSNIDVGCWTPMCENWFQKRLETIGSGEGKPYNSSAWAKNLKYEKTTKTFFANFKVIGRDFLVNDCRIQDI